MVPPDSLFGVIPVWVGVYVLTALAFGVANYVVYHRVFRLVLQGLPVARFDRPMTRLLGAAAIVLGQRKVLQRVGSLDPRSRSIDLAGLGHAAIFWGFLSFSLSYLIFIFGGSIWHPLGETILTKDRRSGLQHLPGYLRGGHPGRAHLGPLPPLDRPAAPIEL